MISPGYNTLLNLSSRTIFPSTACKTNRHARSLQTSSSSSLMSSSTSSCIDYDKVRIKPKREKDATNQLYTKSGRHKSKMLESEQEEDSLTDVSLTLSVESSPFEISPNNNDINRGTSTHSLRKKLSHKKDPHYSSSEFSSNSSESMARPKSRQQRSRSRGHKRHSESRKHRSKSRHHKQRSHRARSAKHHKSSGSSTPITSSSSVIQHNSGARGYRYRLKDFKTRARSHTPRHYKPCSKHYRTSSFWRNNASSNDSGASLNRHQSDRVPTVASICQLSSKSYQMFSPHSSNELLGCGCSPSMPCINAEFCEGCKTLQFSKLVTGRSELGICDRCDYNRCTHEAALYSGDLPYSDFPFRYDTRLGEFVEDKYSTSPQTIEHDEEAIISGAAYEYITSYENNPFLDSVSDKSLQTDSNCESNAGTSHLSNMKLLSYD